MAESAAVARARTARLPGGRGFAHALLSTGLANLADGTRLTAGPLLVAAMTRDPVAVSGALVVQRAPWLLFAVPIGALADRVDRRRVLVASNAVRAAAIGVLIAALVAGPVHLGVVYVLIGLAGVGEVASETAATALTPDLVPAGDLGRANSMLTGCWVVGGQLVGPLIGAVLFTAGRTVPFAVEAAALVAAAVVAAGATHTGPRSEGSAALVGGVTDGVRWLRRQPAVRLFVLLAGLTNVTFAASFAVLVLYVHDRLGLGDIGYGLLLTTAAVGGIFGAVVAPRLLARFRSTDLLLVCLVLEAGVQSALASIRSGVAAAAVVFVFGLHSALWGIIITTARQRAVPASLQGRVGGIFLLVTMGGLTLGAFLGGVLADGHGITAPFWCGAVGNAVLVVVVGRPLWRMGRCGGEAP